MGVENENFDGDADMQGGVEHSDVTAEDPAGGPETKSRRAVERLASLVGLLENLKVDSPSHSSDNQTSITIPHIREHTAGIHNTPSNSAPTPASVPASTSSYSCVLAPPKPHIDTSDPAFVGESSMAAQYDFANNFLEQAFRAGPLQDFRLEMDETLGALRSLVHARKTHNDVREAVFPHAKAPSPAQPYERLLPNATLAMASLRIAKEKGNVNISGLLESLANHTVNPDNPRVGYLWLCNIMSIESFTDRALRVLFSSESSEADYIIVSIGLYWLFFILSIASPDQDLGSHVRREDLIKEFRLCRENLETRQSDEVRRSRVKAMADEVMTVMQRSEAIFRTIHYNPFNPFIVIFCHVIETSNMSDLDRLHDCVASLEPASRDSESTARLHRLFHVLYNVALKYVEVKQNQEQESVGREFDAYLNALGFNPGGAMDMRPGGDGPEGAGIPAPGLGLTMQDYSGLEGVPMSNQDVPASGMLQQGMLLGGWFHTNQQMMGLLEEDTL
ncbi:hypothetical protein SLS64_006135 [Diaporthe eres]